MKKIAFQLSQKGMTINDWLNAQTYKFNIEDALQMLKLERGEKDLLINYGGKEMREAGAK